MFTATISFEIISMNHSTLIRRILAVTLKIRRLKVQVYRAGEYSVQYLNVKQEIKGGNSTTGRSPGFLRNQGKFIRNSTALPRRRGKEKTAAKEKNTCSRTRSPSVVESQLEMYRKERFAFAAVKEQPSSDEFLNNARGCSWKITLLYAARCQGKSLVSHGIFYRYFPSARCICVQWVVCFSIVVSRISNIIWKHSWDKAIDPWFLDRRS